MGEWHSLYAGIYGAVFIRGDFIGFDIRCNLFCQVWGTRWLWKHYMQAGKNPQGPGPSCDCRPMPGYRESIPVLNKRAAVPSNPVPERPSFLQADHPSALQVPTCRFQGMPRRHIYCNPAFPRRQRMRKAWMKKQSAG